MRKCFLYTLDWGGLKYGTPVFDTVGSVSVGASACVEV